MEVEWKNVPAAIWRRYRQGLRPVEAPDPIRWEDLHGIDTQKEKLAHNTERFLAGKPANHALLWGSRGTGKSSLVKALLNRYRHQGLRVIEVDKEDLVHLPKSWMASANARNGSLSTATICPSATATRPTSRSRVCSRGPSNCLRRTCAFTPLPTAAT